jgi:hypothetical protein
MASLIETVRQVEIETDRFVTALSRLQAMETGFDIDVDQLLKSIEQQVRDHERPQAS